MPKTLAERLTKRSANFGILPGRVSVVKIDDLDLASIEIKAPDRWEKIR